MILMDRHIWFNHRRFFQVLPLHLQLLKDVVPVFAVMVTSNGGSSKLSIVSGDEAKIAWEVDLGQTETIRSINYVD